MPMVGILLTRRADSNNKNKINLKLDGVNMKINGRINSLGIGKNLKKKVIRVANAINNGDGPELITGEYKRDFNEIKGNLNTCDGCFSHHVFAGLPVQ